ncbi:hypothetical protein BV25DRAFT_1764272, partial [Artomyces pyxidatus]
LREDLLDGYQCPAEPPSDTRGQKQLSSSQIASLRHYVAWQKSNGTVKAYKLHAQVLEDTNPDLEVLSLHSVRKLVKNLTELEPIKTDMCPHSCLAYTGEYKDLETCPYIRDGHVCGQPRYKAKKKMTAPNKPRAQMMSLPIMATIRALYANADTAPLMRYRDTCLQQALHVVAGASHMYSDFPNGTIHQHHYTASELFQDPRDVAFAISTDGAQLTMKKQSDTWVMLVVILNLPPEIRYESDSTIVAFAIPGPKPPGNIESF